MTLQFKIQLKNLSNPTVWRRIQVPGTFTFHDLHLVIQRVFPWDDYHMYLFSPSGYGSHPTIAISSDDDWEAPEFDALETKLNELFKTEKQTYTYIYDFGDDWIHKITLEKILPENITIPKCIKGNGKCPPEDCGGPWGYENLLEILDNPKHEEHKNIKEWLGLKKNEKWDENEFDLEEVNEWLESEFD